MKKIFTLIAAAFMAAGVNAANLSLGAPSNNTKDGDNVWYDADTKTITFHEAWSYRPGWWFGSGDSGKDLSDYDEIVIEFDGTIDYTIQAAIEYNDASADAVTSFQNTDDKNKIVITLDEQGKSSVKQLYLQSSSAGVTATFAACYAQNDAAEPTQVAIDITSIGAITDNGDGTYTYTTTTGWGWDNIWYGGFDASDYDFIGLELAEASDVNVQVIVEYTDATATKTSVWLSAGSTTAQADLDATGKSSVSQVAFQTSEAATVKVKSLYWGKKDTSTGITSVEAASVDNGAYYNLSGQRVEKPSKGLYIHNGKKVVIK